MPGTSVKDECPMRTPSSDIPALSECRICGKDSDGVHYGCPSCLRCKAFFRRAVLSEITSKCCRPMTCERTARLERMCRHCRYERCMEMGMDPKVVQQPRDSIGKRSRMHLPSPVAMLSPSLDESSNLLGFIARLASSDASLRRKKLEGLSIDSRLCTPEQIAAHPQGIYPSIENVREAMRADISSLLKWLRTSRLFDEVANEDRVFLLSRFMLPYLVLEKCYFNALIPEDGDLWFDYSGKVTSRRWDGPSFDEDGRRVHNETLNYMMDQVTAPMRRLKLCSEEFVACKAVLLLSCGHHSFDDSVTNFISQQSRNAAVRWRTCIVNGLLQSYEANGRPNAAERLGEVLLFASTLQAAAVKAAATITRMRNVNDLRLDAHTENLLFGVA